MAPISEISSYATATPCPLGVVVAGIETVLTVCNTTGFVLVEECSHCR